MRSEKSTAMMSFNRVFTTIALALLSTSVLAADAPTEKSLFAHWNFDEPSGLLFRDSGPGHYDAAADAGAKITRTGGVFGNAAQFTGHHIVRVDAKFDSSKFQRISFSAWVIPTAMAKYMEIFRKEDGNDRVLFSFQDDFTHLSLGLNIGGYIECDAKIRPADVMDGKWHHCAASFDGRTMRVYLDGEEIGSLKRPGRIKAGGAAPACIGSLHGGEAFQGSMDDLRIYSEAISANEVAEMYRAGKQKVDVRFAEVAKLVDELCPIQPTFSQTMEASRRLLAERKLAAQADLRRAVGARIRSKFANDAESFTTITAIHPADYLGASRPEFQEKIVGHVIEMMLEYKPLTPGQWARLAPEQVARWREIEAVSAKFEKLKSQGPEAEFSPQWIELMTQAAGYIEQRPYKNEAVAPYVSPSTPETKDLPPQQAREILEQDWLHQTDNRPTAARIADEIKWTKRLADRLARSFKLDFTTEFAQLDKLADEFKNSGNSRTPSIRDLYLKVRHLKRIIAFKNPLLDFDQILLVDMPFPRGNEWNHETRHRLGYMAIPGARLLILKGLSPDGHLTQLMPQAPLHGSFWRPDVSFDGQRILFCFKPHNEKSFHLYQINIDGTNLVQLTDGPFDDLDPVYLPDGHILFSTTRGHSYVRCMPPTNAYVLARADANGKNIYLVSSNNEPDYLPSVMNDGRVVYTRWEYTDKPLWRDQKLWTINPDGTQVNTLWGNQSVWPDVMKDARAIPNSRRIMFTGSAHHNWFSGSLGIVDPELGLNFPDGLTKITADVAWPECGNGPVDPVESPDYHRSGDFPAYYSPCPLSEQDFLVSANRRGKFCLYMMDVEGNRELIYEGTHNIFHAMPLKARKRPPVIPSRVTWPTRDTRERPDDGVIFSSDVYQGAPDELRGKAKSLRIWHIEPKTYTYWNKRPYISTGPVVSVVQSEGVKRLLGTVPIEDDGSVKFYAPSGISLHFQLLDDRGRALQTMRSFVNVMPGEYRGCLGCHESHSRAPANQAGRLAMSREPSPILPPQWSDTTVSYPRYVQPVWDKYCNKCHAGQGEAAKVLDLSDRPGFLEFSEAYHLLTGRPTWGKPYQKPAKPAPGFGLAGMLMIEGYGTTDPAGYKTPRPMTALSYRSPLIDRCSNGKHYGVKVDEISLQRLVAWVDAMCPYNGDEEIRKIPDPVFQGVDWLSIRPRIQTAPRIARPGPVD